MRSDDIGMFWQDLPQQRGANKIAAVMPDIPDTGWKPPRDFPNLSSAKLIALDTETYDPELLQNGPGWARNKGHIVGVSIGVDGGKWYFPIRHEIEPFNNMPPENLMRWLSDTLDTKHIAKVGANLLYDVGWLAHEGVTVSGPLLDVQFAEALLSETAKVGLDVLARKYLGESKEGSLLYRWCSDYYGGPVSDKQRANIYRAPARLVGPYAETDADLPLRLLPIFYEKLNREGLWNLFDMECRSIPLLLKMRQKGVRVDINKAEQVREELLTKEKGLHERLKSMVGFEVNTNAGASLAKAFEKVNLPYKLTKKGAPSFTKQFLGSVQHPIGDLIREIRTCQKMVGTFIEGYILNAHVNGMIYCQFHPLRGEEFGTRSGRFSSSNPNLQNIPSRDPYLAPLLRGMFVPDIGHVAWRRYDYSQIEYRFLVHFAVGQGIEEVRMRFIQDPTTDFHLLTQQLIKEKTGITLRRKPVKNVNFGLIYGMGIPKLGAQLGLTKSEAKNLFKAYHKGTPFVSATMDEAMATAQTQGLITTILGRKSRFDLWEPMNWDADTIALPYDLAIRKWGQIRRAYTHKALNRRLQGSAADMMKVAMLKCYEDGLFDVTGYPRLTVHDELDFSDPGEKDEAFKEVQRTMETCIKLKIPVKADPEIGPDWGHVKEVA